MKFTCSRLSVCLLLLLFTARSGLYANDSIPIHHLSIDEGLSNNSVRAIFKDHNGFMWFGTYDGLNRYDGYEFKVFRNQLNDTASLPHNYIYTIAEDRRHNLWVGTGQGIGIYNNLSSKFIPAWFQSFETKKREKVTANVNVIKADDRGNIFIGTNGRGLVVQYNGADVGVQLPIRKNAMLTTTYQVRGITVDEKGKVWLFIQEVGLCIYDNQKKQIRVIDQSIRVANCLEADKRGSIWIGAPTGLYQYATAKGSFVTSYSEGAGGLSSGNIASLASDAGTDLWIGTEGGGINILYTPTGTIRYLLPGEAKNTLNSESVFAIYIDAGSRKWMGTLKGGINLIDPQKSRFRTLAHDPLNSNSLVNNFVSSFCEDGDRNLWIGTDGGGMSIWDRAANRFRNYKHEAGNASSLSNNLVNSIKCDDENRIWIATFGGGINRFDATAHSFRHYPCINPSTGEENKNVWLLWQDAKKTLWATTFANGKLYRYYPLRDKFEMFDETLTDLIAFTEDRSGTLWAGNSHQLIKIDKAKKQHSVYEIGKPVRALYEDRQNNFWIGTEGGGLLKFDRRQNTIVARYSDADGLCNNAVLNIVEDGRGNLWLSTFNGLSRFARNSKSFRNFYQSDGLQSNQFLYNSALQLRSGELVFGGVKGFTIFHPDSLHFNDHPSPVIITRLVVNNKPVTTGGAYAVKMEGDRIASLKIPYDDAALSFDFAAPEYSAPDKILYAYYLEGWDKAWNYSGRVRTANYTRLREGTYHLHLKATNAEGAWHNQETELTIIILPPWFRTWWAYFFYCAAFVLFTYLYLRYRTRQTKLEYEVKLAHIETRKEKELAEKKLSFFTDVSHEFRTPLTLIINPLKDFLRYNKAGGDLNIVYRNARRLLGLVDQLLLFQKAGTEGEGLRLTKLNTYTVGKEVYQGFLAGAGAKKIAYHFVCENKDLELYADKEKLEIILYNLLSNALKFTPEGGKIVFAITESEQEVSISVSDTGPGIPAEVADKLFQRFYQVSKEKPASKPGFGIGLYLVKHFIEKHHGRVGYESTEGAGATFTITLQKGRAHFTGQTIHENGEEDSTILNELLEEEPPSDAPSAALEELAADRHTVLVVEDNNEIRDYVAGLFKNRFTVYEARSGEEGLKSAEHYLPDIIISDIMMDNGTGIELCNRVKAAPSLSHIPVILLTGVSSDEMKLRGIEGGADDYITKPFDKDLLMAKVETILKNRTALQNYFFNEITLKKHGLKISQEYKEFLDRCMAIVESHLEDDDFSIKKFSQEIGMSHSNLYRRVKSISGQSVAGFIRFIRLRRAAELLIQTDNNVNEVAFQVGIGDIKYFRKQFNALFGMNPSDYIKKYRPPFSSNYTVNEKMTKPGK